MTTYNEGDRIVLEHEDGSRLGRAFLHDVGRHDGREAAGRKESSPAREVGAP